LAKLSKLEEALEGVPHEWLTHGTVIAVDPSSGSRQSMPAYALAERGVCVKVDSIRLPLKTDGTAYETALGKRTMPLHVRLFLLRQRLLDVRQHVDVVALEALAPYFEGAGGFRNAGVVALHQSAGCIMGCWDTPYCLPVSVRSHQCLMQKLTGGRYIKSDEHDAISILITLFRTAGLSLKNEADMVQRCCEEKICQKDLT
jgi:hypothetical protein